MDLYLILGIVSVIIYYLKVKPASPYLNPLCIAGVFGIFYFVFPQLIIIGFCGIVTHVLDDLYSTHSR